MAPRYWPMARGHIITSPYGPRWGTTHWGIDIGGPGGSAGKPIHAAQGGTVTMAGPASGFGQWIVIDHPTADGSGTTIYGHITPAVRPGQRVEAGERIGTVNGNRATNGGVDPHLHLEVHRSVWAPPGPDRLDPLPWLDSARYPGEQASPPAQMASSAGGLDDPPYTSDWSARFGFGGPRPVSGIIGVCIHTTENDATSRAQDVAQYQLDSKTGSYHVIVDSSGTALRCNTDDWRTWSTGNKGNDVLLHLSFVARARWTSNEWMRHEHMLDDAARYAAHWCAQHDIPVRAVDGDGLRRMEHGITTHDATRAWGGTTHTDPGPGFPMDSFLAKIRAELDHDDHPIPPETGTPSSDKPEPSAQPLPLLDDIRAQLTGSPTAGQYPGFPQLGGLTVVDALAAIGQAQGIPGFQPPRPPQGGTT